jgi:hypothetical protein
MKSAVLSKGDLVTANKLAKTMMLYLLATFDITFNSEPIPVLPF